MISGIDTRFQIFKCVINLKNIKAGHSMQRKYLDWIQVSANYSLGACTTVPMTTLSNSGVKDYTFYINCQASFFQDGPFFL